MSFPRYPSYKDTGVEWWGDMPQEWGLFPAKRSFVRKKELNSGMKCGNRLSLTLGGVVRRDLDDLDGLQASEFETYQVFCADDLVFKLIDLQNIKTSRVGLVPETGIMSPAYIRVEPNKTKVVPRFAYWFFTNLYNRCIFNELGGGVRQTISSEELLLLPYPALPHGEQAHIAEFLDRETGKIDELVAEQRRLMALLKEKRQAVISHAVSRGLNPAAPLKPSGIEWLGDIPAHWTLTPLKWLTDQDRPIMYGIVLPGPDVGEGIPILKGGNVKPSRMNLLSMACTTAEIEAPFARARLKEGDLVYSIRGTIGDCEVVPAELEKSNITQDVARVAIADGNSARWVRWALLASAIRDDLACGSLGAAVRGINIFDLKRVSIPTPPRREQGEIAYLLDSETGKLELLTAEAQRAINLLQERRTALISAAVTGQIDVRPLAEKKAA